MTIDEARAAKAALLERLNLALRDFKNDTGLIVVNLDLVYIQTTEGCIARVGNVEVRL